MIKLRFGYAFVGFATGLILMMNFLWSLPDGKLHMFFCNVGQGDATYIRFPDGKDMLIDGGPNDSILMCLSKHMPFWDRTIDIVMLSHPEKDHMAGLVPVFNRYTIGAFIRSDIDKGTDIDRAVFALVRQKHIPLKIVITGDHIRIGDTKLAIVWPSEGEIAMKHGQSVLGATTSVNEACVVAWLRYGNFDVLFPGDADSGVEGNYVGDALADESVEVLKVPHHGSKSAMSSAFLDWLKPKVAVISVGKNTYGHPSPEALQLLADHHAQVLRTDKDGDVEIVSDGKNWRVGP